MRIANITCERVRNPLLVTVQNPRFSWEIVSEEKNVFQIAYQILVHKSSGVLVWDSGKVESQRTVDIEYKGYPLESLERYTFCIVVWDNFGNKVESKTERFETGFFKLDEWKARWIEPAAPLPQLAENPLPKAQAVWAKCLEAMMKGEQPEYYLDSDEFVL